MIEKKVFGGYVETTYIARKNEARRIAKTYLNRYPKYGYDTHVSNWYVTKSGQICFTMRRLITCE